MKVPTTALMSVVLVLTTLSAISKPTFDVNVLNFPLDEQGNLKVTQMNVGQIEPSWKVINVVENYNLTWTPSLDSRWVYSDLIDLGSVNVSGYSRMKLYMKVTNMTEVHQGSPNRANVQCFVTSVYDYGEVHRGGTSVNWDWLTTTQSLFAEYPPIVSSVYGSMKETVEPSIRITIKGGSNTPNGPVLPSISCLVSIGIYLRND